MRFRRAIAHEAGFTLIEVLIAAVVLIVGVLGVVAVIDQATANTMSTKAREQAVGLEREIVDAARSVGYDQLGPDSVVTSVQHVAGLSDSNNGSAGWTIRRRGVTYNVAVGACSVDDPTDGYGNHDAATFCANGTGAATPTQCTQALAGGDIQGNGSVSGSTVGDCGIDLNLDGRVDSLTEGQVGTCSIGPCGTGTAVDNAPDDYKRIVVLVTWPRGTGARFALQSETLPNPGLATAPSVVTLSANPDSSAGAPITTLNPSVVNFTATTTGKVAAVAWYLDGTPQGNAVQSSAAADTWTFPWSIGPVTATGWQPASGEVLDGPYVVTAKAFDRYAQFGSAASKTVVLNRRVPFAPANFVAGRNQRRNIVEFEWSPNKERDIKTYRVYRDDAAAGAPSQWTLVCDTKQTSCEDSTPPAGSPLHYKIVAVDTFNGGPREGDPVIKDVYDSVTVPNPPANLRLASTDANGAVQLAWDAPASGGVDFYRIYRDGQQIGDRYDQTSGTTYTDTNPLPGAHDYYVTAVGSGFSESNFSNRLTVTR